MATQISISQNEHGLVRLFKVDLSAQQATQLTEAPRALADLLGAAALDMEQLEIFDVADLAGLGLESYLADGHGIDEADLEPHRWQLDALEGPLLILRSAAITHRPDTLTPKEPLRWIATFGEDRPEVPLASQLDSESAKGLGTAAADSIAPSPRWLYLVSALLLLGFGLTLWMMLT